MIGTRARRRGFYRGMSGAGALEFALAAIIAIPLLVGIIEVGRALHSRNALEYAVDQAARKVLVVYRSEGLSVSQMRDRLVEEARAEAPGLAADRLSVRVQEQPGSMRIEMDYAFQFMIPMQRLGEITLNAVRVVPVTPG